MPEHFDISVYTNAPQITLSSGLTLARTLCKISPKSMPAMVKKAAERLKTAAAEAQQAMADRQREQGAVSPDDARSIDQEADTSWSALRDRLSAYASLPPSRFPLAARAATLITQLFGSAGLSFLKGKYDAQWSTMDTLLHRIDGDKLAAEIDQLAGPEFLAQIRDVHPRYEAMVQGRLQQDVGSSQNLLDHVRALQHAIVVYANKVGATVDEDEPHTLQTALKALRPIAVLREQSALARRPDPTAPASAAPSSKSPPRAPKPSPALVSPIDSLAQAAAEAGTEHSGGEPTSPVPADAKAKRRKGYKR